MAAKLIALVCLFAVFDCLNAQYLNRVISQPGCGCGCGQNVLPVPLPVPIQESILPNQVVIGPKFGGPIVELPYGVETIVNPIASAPTTIIQDSTVANNLANALQLLVVSNLLSNTLPTSNDVIVPAYSSPLDFGLMSSLAPINSVVAPISPIVAPMNPILSPINSCGCGQFSYIY